MPKKIDKYEFIRECGLKKTTDLNSWGFVLDCRDRLIDHNPPLEQSWQLIKGLSSEPKIPIDGVDLGDRASIDDYYVEPFWAFMNSMMVGVYPPPEVLMSLAECFNLYINGEGSLDLEDVFFGDLVTGAGNLAKRLAKGGVYNQFHMDVQYRKLSPKYHGLPTTPLTELAGIFLQKEFVIKHYKEKNKGQYKDTKDFLRGYRAWLKEREGRNNS